MPVDPDVLTVALDQLARTDVPTTEEAITRVVGAAALVLDVSGAGLMLLDDRHALRYVAASDDAVGVLEEVQEEAGVGPCVDSLLQDVTVVTPDVTMDPRWPILHSPLRRTPVRAVLGAPVSIGGPVGSLNVYSGRPSAFDVSDQLAIEAFAEVIEHLLATAVAARRSDVVVSQLEHALEHRVTIERATGMLMGRDGLEAAAAFNVLRRRARDSGRKVADIALEVLAGEPFEPVP
ncbi:MAG: GAF and ANTAR domain-containing protein [Acidimicrobiales bacterium]